MSNTISPEYDHVAIFKDHVSWVVGYEYIGRIGDGYHYKIHTDFWVEKSKLKIS